MATDSKIEDFAEELGKLLATAQAKAQSWLGQRTQITKTLEYPDVGIDDWILRTRRSLLVPCGPHRLRLAPRRRAAYMARQP
jgi:hypothetical protein